MTFKGIARLITGLMMMGILGACGVGLPNVTPTLAPTDTPFTPIAQNPTLTPLPLISPTLTMTVTATPSPSFTPSPTETPTPTDPPTEPPPTTSASPTSTATPTDTATATFTPVPTETVTASPTAIPTETPTPSLTPLPLPVPSDTPTPSPTPSLTPTPTATDTPLPTVTPTLTFTPSATFTPQPTFTPTLDGTSIMEALQTQSAQQTETASAELPPTFTAIPEPSPTITLVPLDVTPTFITATPADDDLGIIISSTQTPIPSTPEISDIGEIAPTLTPTLDFPTPLPPESITTGFVTPLPPPIFNTRFDTNFVQAFTFTGVQELSFNGRELQGGVNLFAPNPAFPDSFARTLPSGLLVFSPPNGAEQPFEFAPFFEGYDAFDARSNKNYVSEIAWSPDGLKLAYLIAPPAELDNVGAGVWFWQPERTLGTDPTYTLLHDCPGPGWLSCSLVSGRPANHWQTIRMEWSPDSTRLLLTLNLVEEGRRAITVVNAVRDAQYANNAPPFYRYDSGMWLRDGRILVSGRGLDGQVIIARVNADFNTEEILFNASANNLWVQDAVERSDGVIVAFGRDCCPDGALRLYRGDGVPLSDFIGDRMPDRIEWANNRAYATVTVGGTQYVVNATNGTITRAEVANRIEIGSSNVPIAQQASGDSYPTGIVEGSRYQPGQQVRYIGAGERNMRAQPSVTTGVVVGSVLPSEFVAILAGPFDNEGYIWWLVANARDVRGWIAGESNGTSLLDP